MLSKVNSCAVIGLDGEIVDVEVDIVNFGLPKFAVVGLPDTAVQEARERVMSAIRNSGLQFPKHKITVSLAPADLRKEGPAYDLPIAVGILVASGQVPEPRRDAVFIGELSLNGRLRHTNGVLPMVGLARQRGFTTIFVPDVDQPELIVFELRKDRYEQVAHVMGDEPFRAERPFTVEVAPSRLVAGLLAD